jgi:hypothetical protein
LKERQKGREAEEENISSYRMALRKENVLEFEENALDRTLWRARF